MLRIAIGTAIDAPGPLGNIITRIHTGRVESGSKLSFHPRSWVTKLKTIKLNGKQVAKVTAGEMVELVVEGPLAEMVKWGSVITSSCEGVDVPDPVKEALSFTVELLVLDVSFTQKAQQYLCTVHEADFTVAVSFISCSMNRKTGK
ncbi:unnamed protein product [Cuscuta campestris]|uniref:Translation elongation factor EFTu-like domain-containing protein n=1 Tax=Cuscuta campestris TaxID=132261 RepID=A0A484LYV3_9ASTE|nr:unnamed protein product [Cuscuta campestris]